MEKRVVLAIALSFLAIGAYQMALQHFYPEVAKMPTHISAPAKQTSVDLPAVSQGSVESGLTDQESVAYETPEFSFLLTENQGGIRRIAFKKYAQNDKALMVLDATTTEGLPTSIQILPAAKPAKYTASVQASKLQMNAVQDGIAVTKNYSFDGYKGTLSVTFENKTPTEKNFQYQIFVGRSLIPREPIDSQYLETNFYVTDNGKNVIRHIRESGKGKSVKSEGNLHWVAVKDRHFSVIVRPEDGTFAGLVEGLGNHTAKTSLISQPVTLPAGRRVEQHFTLYVGPNEIDLLEPIGLDPLINFGKMDVIGKLLVGALELLHNIARNYGLAIILLTICINVLFFPLTRVSYMSMKRMQAIQPMMNKLREQNKNNPEKLNKEMMELYKKYKVNPFAGCLPLILQMPVFIALYVALSKSVFLINAKFLWINDLSKPDSVHFPFTLPVIGNEIHILPLVMVCGMVVQQKFTQMKMDGQDPAMAAQQRMMAVMMPILFGFIFYGMPAALVLYWLTNTVLMTSYQLYLKKKSPIVNV